MGENGVGRPLKKPRRLKAWLVFLDKSGFLLAPLMRRNYLAAGTHTLFAAAISKSGKSVEMLTRCSPSFLRGVM